MTKIKKKTHSGASKRFTKLKSGLVKAKASGKNHILTKKNRKLKRNKRRSYYVNASFAPRFASVL